LVPLARSILSEALKLPVSDRVAESRLAAYPIRRP
jgi:hypothetical protein